MKKLKYILTSVIFIFCLTTITPTYADDKDNGNQGTVNGVSINGPDNNNGNNGNGNSNGNNGNAYGVSGNGNGQGNNGNGNGNGGSNGGAPLPINGGIMFLLVAGVAIGTVVIYKQGKKGLVNTTV